MMKLLNFNKSKDGVFRTDILVQKRVSLDDIVRIYIYVQSEHVHLSEEREVLDVWEHYAEKISITLLYRLVRDYYSFHSPMEPESLDHVKYLEKVTERVKEIFVKKLTPIHKRRMWALEG